MPVETFAYIDSLNPSNPPGSDGLAQGDDHLRGIKTALKNTFTGLTGATAVTQTTLNSLQANTHEFFVPVGAIVDFLHGVPTGFLECNGATVSRTTYSRLFAIYGIAFGAGDGSTFGLPNLSDRYRRARGSYAVNVAPNWTVGTHNHTASAATSVTVASDGSHAHGTLTEAVTANHTHGFTTGAAGTHSHTGSTGSADRTLDHTHSVPSGGSSIAGWINAGSFTGSSSAVMVSATSGGSSLGAMDHAHTISSDGSHTHTGTTGIENQNHAHGIDADGAHTHSGSTAATSVTVNNSTTQENMPNSYVVITCVKY